MSTRFTLGNPLYAWGAPQFKNREEQLAYDLEVTQQRLRALEERPCVFAAVTHTEGEKITIATGQQTIEVRKPKAMEGLENGAVVRVFAGDPPAIHGVVAKPPATGPICMVKQLLEDGYIEVAIQNQVRSVLCLKGIAVAPGDRVVLDGTATSIVKNFGCKDSSRVVVEETGVSWDDIGGLDDVKKELIEAIEEPVRHAALYQRYGRRPVRGVLLYGPPGTGKTMLGKAAATAQAAIHGASAKQSGFIYVKGPDLLNMFVGNSEANIRALFDSAREHFHEHGYPAIIFIDEADALMGKRGRRMGMEGMERTIVPQFLAEMDGLEDARCMVLLATNRPDTLDPAVVREGRVDRKVFVRRPNKDEAAHIFKLYLKRVPLTAGTQLGELAALATRSLFDDRHALYVIRTKSGHDRRFGLPNLVSGSKIAALVDDASQRALRRERDGQKGPHGVSLADLEASIKASIENERNLDHTAEISSFVEDEKIDATGIDKVK